MSNKVVNMLQQGGSESRGSLQVVVLSENNRPVENARVQISYTGEPDNVLEELVTNSSGRTEPINLLAPPLEYSLNPGIEQPYSEYTLRITAEDFAPLEKTIHKINFAKDDPTTISSYEVYFSLYQQLAGKSDEENDDENEDSVSKFEALFDKDFFETQRAIKTNSEIIELLVENAIKLEDEDIQINKKIGEYGSEIIPKGATILTHCNAGALATVGWGTALGVVRSAFEKDKTIKVFADETRPRGQGARLTTYELTRDGIDTTLITDGMGAYFMNKKMIDVVVVGADRIALNGDSANKIGTYMVAISAKYHNIPFCFLLSAYRRS